MKSVVFTVQSSYARFRCPYTTTSALTFNTIHPIAVKGLVGAILGIDYAELFEYTQAMRVGIQVLSPVYKDMQSFNMIAMVKNNGAANFQSRVQFLRDVKYRIFIWDGENKSDKLETVLKSGEYIFTPYLGCSEHIAKLDYEGVFNGEPVDGGQLLDTITPKEFVVLNDDEIFNMHFDRIPVKNSKEREYTEYKEIVFSPGKKLKASKCDIYKVGEYNVFFF